MPLCGYNSLCDMKARTITSQDKGGKQKHEVFNNSNSEVYHYQIDGYVIKEGNRCDYLVLKDRESGKTAFLIELKGSDLCWAAIQLDETAAALASTLKTYQIQYRIVANKCKTQQIESSSFKRYRKKWGKSLKYSTLYLKDTI